MSEEMNVEVDDKGQVHYQYSGRLERMGIDRDSRRYIDSISEAIMYLKMNFFFYGALVSKLTIRVTDKVKTAQVQFLGENIVMSMNPDFMAAMTMIQRAGVIKHECIHVIAGHLWRPEEAMRSRPEWAWFIVPYAADWSVNSYLDMLNELPPRCLHPSQHRRDNGNFITEKERKEGIGTLQSRLTFEEYLDIAIEWTKKRAGKQPEPKDLLESIETFGEMISKVHGKDSGIVDEHDIEKMKKSTSSGVNDEGEDVESISVRSMESIVRSKVLDARNETIRSQGRMPGDVESIIGDLIAEKPIRFERLFRGIIGSFLSTSKVSTMMRFSRRYGTNPGSIRKKDVLRLTWYQDVSGSMSDDDICLCLSEALHAETSGMAVVEVVTFDVTLQKPVSVRRLGTVDVSVFGGGGTCLKDVIQDIEERRPDVAVIASDGFLEHDLLARGTKVVWVLTSHSSDPGWGRCVKLPLKHDAVAGARADIVRRSS